MHASLIYIHIYIGLLLAQYRAITYKLDRKSPGVRIAPITIAYIRVSPSGLFPPTIIIIIIIIKEKKAHNKSL